MTVLHDSVVFPSAPAEEALAQHREIRRTLTHTHPSSPPSLPPTLPRSILTDKMASENNSDPQDEKTALVARDAAEEADLQLQSSEQSEAKMTLYHWTQSFNSQKVSPRFSTTEGRTAPLMMQWGGGRGQAHLVTAALDSVVQKMYVCTPVMFV